MVDERHNGVVHDPRERNMERDEEIIEGKKEEKKSLKVEAGGVRLCLSACLLLEFPSIIGFCLV